MAYQARTGPQQAWFWHNMACVERYCAHFIFSTNHAKIWIFFLHRKYFNFIDLVIMNIHQSYMNIQTSVTCFSWWIWLVGRKRGRSFSKRHVYNGKWRHNGRDGVSNHQPHDCLHNRLFRRRSKKTSKLRVIGLCVGNSPGPGEFPAQMTSNAETVFIWWRHHAVVAKGIWITWIMTTNFASWLLSGFRVTREIGAVSP